MMYKYIRFLLIYIYLFAFAAVAEEQTLEAGILAVENQDYMKAYQIFKVLADQGDAEAQHNLAVLYRQGKGVMQDVNIAAELFRKSANQGLPSAQYYLGHLYDIGSGVEKNPELAVKWYQKAAEQGEPLAQANLGVAYANGEGVRQDIILAYVWFSLAASQGLTAALENRNLLKQDMSEELVENAQRLTREYFARYVEPYQAQVRKLTGNRHSQLPGVHSPPPSPAKQSSNKQEHHTGHSASGEENHKQ